MLREGVDVPAADQRVAVGLDPLEHPVAVAEDDARAVRGNGEKFGAGGGGAVLVP